MIKSQVVLLSFLKKRIYLGRGYRQSRGVLNTTLKKKTDGKISLRRRKKNLSMDEEKKGERGGGNQY